MTVKAKITITDDGDGWFISKVFYVTSHISPETGNMTSTGRLISAGSVANVPGSAGEGEPGRFVSWVSARRPSPAAARS